MRYDGGPKRRARARSTTETISNRMPGSRYGRLSSRKTTSSASSTTPRPSDSWLIKKCGFPCGSGRPGFNSTPSGRPRTKVIAPESITSSPRSRPRNPRKTATGRTAYAASRSFQSLPRANIQSSGLVCLPAASNPYSARSTLRMHFQLHDYVTIREHRLAFTPWWSANRKINHCADNVPLVTNTRYNASGRHHKTGLHHANLTRLRQRHNRYTALRAV